MTPHLEYFGAGVRNTEHKTGDMESDNGRKAHALLREHPERYDEVTDDKEKVCETDEVEQTSEESTGNL
ncbi:MAG: hypothetical protein NT162_03340 [Candidatus Woesebacteria bacterium]|nr:hypothetical protein [Candidatus Woesebacteria bacterium]